VPGSHLARWLTVILGAARPHPDYALIPSAPGYNNSMIRTVGPLPLFSPVDTPEEGQGAAR
jgi:hypothetical protein